MKKMKTKKMYLREGNICKSSNMGNAEICNAISETLISKDVNYGSDVQITIEKTSGHACIEIAYFEEECDNIKKQCHLKICK